MNEASRYTMPEENDQKRRCRHRRRRHREKFIEQRVSPQKI
jgi:hypothetical protein